MAASLRLAWRDGVAVESDDQGTFRVQGPAARIGLRRLPAVVLDALARLDPPGEEEQRLLAGVQEAAGPGVLSIWMYWLRELASRGLVCRTVLLDEKRLATLTPICPAFSLAPAAVDRGRSYRLSRFAYLHQGAGCMVLESPLALARVVLDDPRVAALVAALANPATVGDLAPAFFPADAVALLLGLLQSAGMLEPDSPEPADQAVWEFHDLLFHARSRKGRSDAPFGGAYRMAGRMAPPPALRSSPPGERIPLPAPDLDRLRTTDVPLTAVIEDRRSLRDYGPTPISLGELGEFLFRVARVKECGEVETPTPAGPLAMSFTSRPYPAGGGLYELEFYIVSAACFGLDPGLYHYDPLHHALGKVCGPTADVEHLLTDAAGSAGVPRAGLQVLLILTARFGRLAWKYSSIAYALTLKHVGVVYQTMYLTATAMGLAPCALGCGDTDRFSRASGLDFCTETSVGEFLLGSRPPSPEYADP